MVIRKTVLIVALLLPAPTFAQDAPGTVKYPVAQDSADSLIRAADNAAGKLKNSISATATTLTLSGSADAFPASGILTIDGREVLTYTSRDGSVFNGLARGQFGTTALTFAAGVTVELRILAAYHNTLSLAVRNLEAKLGTGANTPQTGYLPFGMGAGASAWRAMAGSDITAALGYTPANPAGLVATSRAVSGTSPMQINGGASGTLAADLTISCLTASGSQPGCLSANDWTAFNSKQPAGNYLTDPGAGGMLSRTSLNTVTPRQIAVGANLSVSNANGASGNPTISLGSNVATSVVNDTNVTGAISSNALTLGWSGTLAKSRQHGATVYTDQANTFGNFVQTFQAGANHLLVDPTDITKKFQFDASNIATATTRTVNIPNANSTTVQSSSAGANQFAIGIGAQGAVSYAQPSFSNLSGSATSGQLPSSVVYSNQANAYIAGNKQSFGPNATSAGLNVGSVTGDPSSLANGDVWYDSTGNALKARINGSTVSLGAGGGGISAIGTIDSQTKSANGAVISGSSIYAQTADASNPGLVSTGNQTFAGNKSFNDVTTHGDGTYSNGANANAKTPTTALFTKGVTGTPHTSTSPIVSVSDVFDSVYTAGVGRVNLWFEKGGAANQAGYEGLTITATQSGAINNGGMTGLYIRAIPSIGGTNSSHFAGASTVQRFVKADETSWEFDIDSQYSRTITAATNASPIVITSALVHGLATGDKITMSGVAGNTAANGDWTITVVDSTHFSLQGSTGNGTYTSGGTFTLWGSPDYSIPGARSIAVAAIGAGNAPHTVALMVGVQGTAAKFYTGLDIAQNAILSTGRAIRIPNAIPITSRDSTNTTEIPLIQGNASNQVSIDSGANGTVFGGSIRPGMSSFVSNTAQIYKTTAQGLVITATTGTSYDLLIAAAAGGTLLRNPTGTSSLEVAVGGSAVLGNLIINGSSLISKHLSATATWNPPSLTAASQTTTTLTVTGATLGDTVAVGFSLDLQGMQMTGYVSAANTVTVVLRNGTAGTLDLASGTLRADCWEH